MLDGINIYILGVFGSIILYQIVGFYAIKQVKNLDDYYVSGRNATTLFMSGTLFASMLSINGFMGDAAYAYGGNISTLTLINTLCACGYILGPLFFGRYIRRSKANTMPSYFGDRFNSIRIRRFAGIITVVSLSAYFLSVIQGTSILMEMMTGYEKNICLFLSWLCIMTFTLLSGSKGVILTDTVQCIIFLVATIIAGPYLFDAAGGIENIVSTLANNSNTPIGLLSYHGNIGNGTIFENIMYGITMGIVWLMTISVSPWQAGRNLMAKNEHVIFRSGVISAFLTVAFLFYIYLMSISIIPIYPHMPHPEKVLIWSAYEIMPKFVGMFLLVGIMAAGLSSASTFLSVVSFSLSVDILGKKFENTYAQLKFTKIIVMVIGIILWLMAYCDFASIRIIAWFASTIIASSWGYIAFASVWSKKLTERGAYYSMVGGFIGYLLSIYYKEVLDFPLKNLFDPFYIGIFISIIAAVIGSNKQKKTQQEIIFQQQLHILPESERVPRDYKIDKMYGAGLIFAGIVISIFLIIYWALPYNALIKNEIFRVIG